MHNLDVITYAVENSTTLQLFSCTMPPLWQTTKLKINLHLILLDISLSSYTCNTTYLLLGPLIVKNTHTKKRFASLQTEKNEKQISDRFQVHKKDQNP